LLLGGSTTIVLAHAGDAWSDGRHTIRLYDKAGGWVISSAVLTVA